jgi:hypothetical protein
MSMRAIALLERTTANRWRARYFRLVAEGAIEGASHEGDWPDVRAVMLETLAAVPSKRPARTARPTRPC